jgi:6-phosphogluconolactonase
MLVYTSGSDSPEIRVMDFDEDAATYTPLHTFDAGPGSGYLAFGGGGKRVYAINRTPARVIAFAVERTGALQRMNEVLVPGVFGSTHLAVHPAGHLLMVAHFGSGHVSVHALGPDGAVGDAIDVQDTAREAHQAVCTTDGRFLFVPCRAGDVVCQFVVDPASGKLGRNDPFMVSAKSGAGPRHMAVHPSQRFAFVLNELDGTMTTYRLDPERGQLSALHTVASVPDGFAERAAAHIEVHPAGRFVYASNREHGSIAMWAFDPNGARLQLLGHETAGGRIKSPRDFTLGPNGATLLVANQAGGLLLAFAIEADGTLCSTGAGQAQAAPTFIGVLPDAAGGRPSMSGTR